jgi:hypothetical protein
MTPNERLEALLVVATKHHYSSTLAAENQTRLVEICRSTSNRACVRLLMACLLAKLDRPEVDPRKPYTEIGSPDSFSGRTYDERYISQFIQAQRLPCNSTTAFLTPVLRNINRPLTLDVELIGKPRQLYIEAQRLLHEVAEQHESAEKMLTETLHQLLLLRDERQAQTNQLLSSLNTSSDKLALSSDDILALIHQHLACKNSSRLPVLLFAAAYQAVGFLIGEQPLGLKGYLSADEQTGAIGDLEIRLVTEQRLGTVYEMKQRTISQDDLDRAVQKLSTHAGRVDNYIFVTTDRIDPAIEEYARKLYESTAGTEFVILDCLGFLKHFLHFFHRHRLAFLNAYQELVLAEPESSVNHALKQAFLSLRQVAQLPSE